MNITLLLLLAITPGLLIALYFYLRDLREPEPTGLIWINILFGIVSFFISRGLGFLLHQFIYTGHEDRMQQLLIALIFIGLLGEGSKFLFLRGFTFYYKSFNQPFDGIVYAVMVGMGYATAENVFYAINVDAPDMLRMFTVVPANAVFAVIMGYFLGEAKLFKNRIFIYSLLALVLPVIAHGYYDYFLDAVYVRGLWLEAIVSLLIVVLLSQIAIKKRKAENLRKLD